MMISYHQKGGIECSTIKSSNKKAHKALKLSDDIGVKAVAEQLGIKYFIIDNSIKPVFSDSALRPLYDAIWNKNRQKHPQIGTQ